MALMALMAPFEPKPDNESCAKNGSKCVFFILIVSFLHYLWPQKITGFPFWEDVAERQNAT